MTLRLRPMVAHRGHSADHLFPVEVIGLDPARSLGDSLKLESAPVGIILLCVRISPLRRARRGARSAVTARRLAAAELSLPIHPYLTDHDIEYVIDACRAVPRA